VRTHVASHVKPTTARLNGSVDRGGAPVKVHFEFGLTKAYGSRTDDQQLAPGNAPIEVSAPIAGLAPRTKYHFRVVAVTDFGVVYGQDRTFRTKAHYPLIKQKRLWMTASGNVQVRLRCTSGAKCSGTVKLSAKHRTLGTRHYSIPGGHVKLVKVHLKPRAQELVRNSHKLPVTVTTGGSHRTLVMRWTK